MKVVSKIAVNSILRGRIKIETSKKIKIINKKDLVSLIKEYLEIKNQMANIQDEFSNIGKGKKVFLLMN